MKNYLSQFIHSVPFLLGLSFIFLYFQVDVPSVYSKYFGVFDLTSIAGFAFFVVYTLIWFLVAPVAANKVFFREKLNEMGLMLPKNKKLALLLIACALLLLLPCIYYFAKLSQFQGYSLGASNIGKVLFMTIFLFPFYYIGEEFFFRGFLFIGLWKRVGWHSFWITDIIFTVTHLGKPVLEILLCIPASVIFNCLTLFTRSIYPAVIVHTTMGILLSVLVTFNLASLVN